MWVPAQFDVNTLTLGLLTAATLETEPCSDADLKAIWARWNDLRLTLPTVTSSDRVDNGEASRWLWALLAELAYGCDAERGSSHTINQSVWTRTTYSTEWSYNTNLSQYENPKHHITGTCPTSTSLEMVLGQIFLWLLQFSQSVPFHQCPTLICSLIMKTI